MSKAHDKALNSAKEGGTDKMVLKHLREQRKQKRIEKLVRNAPEGSALRPWSYEHRKYL